MYLEEKNLLVIKFQGGKWKPNGVKDEECYKYVQMETNIIPKLSRNCVLHSDSNVEGISASCVDGVLNVTVPKIVGNCKLGFSFGGGD